MRPVASASSSARYGAPFRVCSFCFLSTAYTPSTTLFSDRSATALTGPILRYVPVVADVRPFTAERYTGRAGPLEDLVAPPYDVIAAEERQEYLARSPYNVVHLTLPDSDGEAGRSLRSWRES